MDYFCNGLLNFIMKYLSNWKRKILFYHETYRNFIFLAYPFIWKPRYQRGSELQRASAAYKEGDYDTALQTFKPLAEKGDMIAQFNLAKMYREGKGVPKDYKTAVKWFSLSAEQGNAKAQYHLGVAHSFGLGVVPDYKKHWNGLKGPQNKVILFLNIIFLGYIIWGMEFQKIKYMHTCGQI